MNGVYGHYNFPPTTPSKDGSANVSLVVLLRVSALLLPLFRFFLGICMGDMGPYWCPTTIRSCCWNNGVWGEKGALELVALERECVCDPSAPRERPVVGATVVALPAETNREGPG